MNDDIEELDRIQQRLAGLRKRLNALEARLEATDIKFKEMEA